MATGDPLNPWAITAYTYSPIGQRETVTDPAGDVARTQYDAIDRPFIVTDPDLRKVKTVYDAAGQILKLIKGFGTPKSQDYQTFTYGPNGQALTVADANGNLTAYDYDGHDRRVKTTFPDGNPGLPPGGDYETVG